MIGILVLTFSTVFIPAGALGSWVQLGGVIKDKELKKVTDAGSISFLKGTIKVQEAMIKLDEGTLKEAAEIGLNARVQFNEAQKLFEQARNRITTDKKLAAEFQMHLRQLNFEIKAKELGIRAERSNLWTYVQGSATEKGVAALFSEATTRSNATGTKSEEFFKSVGAGKYKPIAGAALLRQMAEDIEFGAYVSAILEMPR